MESFLEILSCFFSQLTCTREATHAPLAGSAYGCFEASAAKIRVVCTRFRLLTTCVTCVRGRVSVCVCVCVCVCVETLPTILP